MYQVTKTYGNEEGLSCVFRQWKAESHCSKLHGYALGFRFTFQCEDDELTEEGWVVDFGDLDHLRDHLHKTFDHKLIIGSDDPDVNELLATGVDIAKVTTLYRVGCEAFARHMYKYVRDHITHKIYSVECFEHKGNSAIYIGERK